MSRKILLIEDDPDISRLVTLHLSDLPAEVEVAADGESGLELVQNGGFDLLILDLMLPGIDGLEVCRRLRADAANYLPILMLTARSAELDRVVGLETGADDYLSKPFSVLELAARVRALLRRVDALRKSESSAEQPVLEVRGLAIDEARRAVTVDGQPARLTAKEFDLLAHFARYPGHVFTRSQLLDRVWGYANESYEHTVNSHINRLRAKIEPDPARPRYVLTVWGVGYTLPEEEPETGT